MDICEINNILLNGENTTVEFKKAEINVPESLYETISSFSNRDGGIIILGVDDTGKVLGIEDLKTPKFSFSDNLLIYSKSAKIPNSKWKTRLQTKACLTQHKIEPLSKFRLILESFPNPVG